MNKRILSMEEAEATTKQTLLEAEKQRYKNMKGNLYLMMGFPRSGKSTLADKFAKELDATIICADDFRKALYNQAYIAEAEEHIFAMTLTATRALLLRGQSVIVDETHSRLDSLRKWLKIDPNLTIFYVPTSVQECKRRATFTNQEYLYPVIDRHYKNMRYTLNFLEENYEFENKNDYFQLNKKDNDILNY